MDDGAKHASLGCYRATFTHQYSLCYDTKEPLFHTNSGSIGVEKRLFLYIMGSKTMQNPTKTARQISRIDFYFVTGFYRLYDICMSKILLIEHLERLDEPYVHLAGTTMVPCVVRDERQLQVLHSHAVSVLLKHLRISGDGLYSE